MPMTDSPRQNNLLASLPAEDYCRLAPQLRTAPLKNRQMLQRRGEPLQDVYFPDRSLCALVMPMADGSTPEIAPVGAEGFIGVESALGLSRAFADVTVHVAGDAVCHVLSADSFRRELDHGGTFHATVMRYAHAFVEGLEQSVACSGLHAVDARCCRWLLQAQDRLGCDELAVTHDVLASMLGVRRPTVTLIIADLSRHEIVSGSRGVIAITDRAALEGRACECYRVEKRRFAYPLPVASTRTFGIAESSDERASVLAS